MIRVACAVAFALIISVHATAVAEEPESSPGPQKAHHWLQQLVGQWESQSEGTVGPDQPPIKFTGIQTSKLVGGFWVVSEVKGDVMGMSITAVQTIGYNSAKKKYVGTWIDSTMDHLWQYEGDVDESGKKLTLQTEGPNFMDPGTMATFRDAYEFKSADHIIATSSILTKDGKWVTFMTGDMRRKKPR